MTSRTDPAPVRATDYAALSAGWGALLGAVLVAARDKGDEPVRSADVLPLGVATFALSKLVAKEKVDVWVRAVGGRTPTRRRRAMQPASAGCAN